MSFVQCQAPAAPAKERAFTGSIAAIRQIIGAMVLVMLAMTLASGGPTSAAPAQQLPVGPPSEGSTYQLVDTWEQRPWTLTAGHYGQVGDISSAPDGTTFVLDVRDVAGRPRVIHVLEADGRPRELVTFNNELTDRRFRPQRLDVGFDGILHVLSSPVTVPVDGKTFVEHRVWRLRADGTQIDRFEVRVESPRTYVDIAVRDDGRVYLVRQGRNPWCVQPQSPPLENVPGEEPSYSLDVFAPNGQLLEILTPAEMAIAIAIDVAREGTTFVIHRIPSPCSPGPGGPGDPPPTARPSTDNGVQAGDAVSAGLAQAQVPPRVPGVLVLEPHHAYRETVAFVGGDDIAVGPAGVYVSRNVEIFHLLEDGGDGRGRIDGEPVLVGPTGHIFAGYLRRIVFYMDVPADGRVTSGMNHCYYQGFLAIDDPSARPASAHLVGELDAVELEGPAFPLRVAAAVELAVLLGRMDIGGGRPNQQYRLTNYTTEAQTVQRWSLHGAADAGDPRSQVGLCPAADSWYGSDKWMTRDVAIDGTDIYVIDPELVQRRPDDGWPVWTYWPGFLLDDPDAVSFLGAIDADAGRAAMLDYGAGTVVVVDSDGAALHSWPYATGDDNHPVDIAVDGDRVYLADRARGRVVVRALDGARLAEWPTHDGPRALAVAPSGDVLVLGQGGYGFHYNAQGLLVASWPMPDLPVEARDIAVGDDGRVYVNFVGLAPTLLVGTTTYTTIEAAGVWIFERTGRPSGPPPQPKSCVPRPDKWAGPPRIPLGGTVDITLTVDGWCPGRYDDAQIVFVVDTSRSMLLSDSIGQGRVALMTMLDELDPARTEVGLVTFDFGPTLLQPLTRDLSGLRTRVAALAAEGDTQLGGALEVAYNELTGERGKDDARRVIIVISDGVFKDPVERFPPAVRLDIIEAGIEMAAVIFPSWEFRADHRVLLDALTGDPNKVTVQPEEAVLQALVRDLTGYTAVAGLFERITVIDKVPDNMTYMVDSARPPATWDQNERTLTWQFGVTMADQPLSMTYTLRPQQVGTWPTNVWARGPYRDALGNESQVIFPIPEVEVWALENSIYLPFGLTCPKPRRADIVLIMDASSSMLEVAEDGRTKADAAREAATTFVDAVQLGGDRIAVVEFNDASRVVSELSGDRGAVLAGLEAIRPSLNRQGTRIDLGLVSASEALAARRADALPVVIVLTDGYQTNPPGTSAVLENLASLINVVPEVVMFAIGLGSTVDMALLGEVAGARERTFMSPSPADLRAVYAAISARLGCL